MFHLTIILSLYILTSCQKYSQLKKHSSVKVAPLTRVYFDIKDFETGELISLEIKMDLFFGGNTNRYDFYIEQVPATSYYDPYYWDLDHLRFVENGNVTCDSDRECTFTWEEIKEEGKNFIFIIPPAPFDDFYTFWDKKIKIKNPGGELSGGAIAGIVIGCILFAALAITLIAIAGCCCCNKSCGDCCPSCACCACCFCCNRIHYMTGMGINVQVQPAILPPPASVPVYPAQVPPPVYPQPIYPTPAYQPGIAPAPYSSAAFV